MLADLLSESFAADYQESWERERTATVTRAKLSLVHQKSSISGDTR